MAEIQKNLVIIDYQNDFVALDGGLTCGQPAIDIENNILNLIDNYNGDNIFVTLDTHYTTDWGTEQNKDLKTNEAEIYPLHCVYNTDGHKLFGKLEKKLSDVEHEIIYKNSFASDKLVKSILYKNDPNLPIEIKFCGVATNVCVFQNIILLYNYLVQNNLTFSIVVDKNCVASFDSELEQQSLDYLKNVLGVIVNY